VRGRIYFIGGGPGDPSLITVRGMELLKDASMVLASGIFMETYREHIGEKECFDPFDLYHSELVGRVDACLDRGLDVVFLVPGDLAIFSPVQSLIDYFGDAAVVVPGVSTLNAASAALKRTFDLPTVSHSTIATSPKTITGSPDTVGELSKHKATMVLFMNNRAPEALSSELSEGYAPETPVAVVYMVSLPEEEIQMTTVGSLATDVDRARFEDEDVYKLVIVGPVLTAREDPSWWDKRKDMRDARHARKKAGLK